MQKRTLGIWVLCMLMYYCVLEGRIHPGRVFDFTTDLDGIAQAYAAMDERRAIKSLVKVGTV